MALRTLDAMAAGGIFDHLGGGFARYSVDAHWLLPHFEKMLYDNAELANTYLTAFLATGEERYARVARLTLDYLLRDMQDEGGGFYSSEDADSEGEEGRFYTFSPAEVCAILGDADGGLFCEAFGIQAAGHTEAGKSVLHRFSAPENLAESYRLAPAAMATKLESLQQRMWEAREQRVHPHKDDKVLTSWNGLALSAMARGHQVLKDARYRAAALACAAFLQKDMFKDGVLLRTWRQGRAHTPGFLEDYAAVALGLVDLYETTFETHWLRWAEQLVEIMRERFEDSAAGGFYSTEAGQSDLILRQKPAFDHSLASANALAVQALLRLAEHLDRADLKASAEHALRCFAPILEQAPRVCLGLLEGLEWVQQGPLEIVLAGPQQDPRMQALIDQTWSKYLVRRVLALAVGDSETSLHREKVPVHGQPTAYVCMNRACRAPVTSPEALEALLPVRQI